MSDDVDLIRRLGPLWNDGDLEGVMSFYADDVEVITDPGWPEGSTTGKEAFRRTTEGWLSAWESVTIEMGETLEAGPGRVLAEGAWVSRGASSGVDSRMAFSILYDLEDGLITRMQWFLDGAEARRAAGLS